ncbi:hypothetical protein P7K49_037981 [Saguinus oedipus]|uniref:Uncharacterized protein n=1 Tax=Saguinus oedipus TaxID=9490 RepID=A0ABQ9TDE1_SAGOE|nr:hypothetical protein P7K49_037981 [Saguinus oedipus]
MSLGMSNAVTSVGQDTEMWEKVLQGWIPKKMITQLTNVVDAFNHKQLSPPAVPLQPLGDGQRLANPRMASAAHLSPYQLQHQGMKAAHIFHPMLQEAPNCTRNLNEFHTLENLEVWILICRKKCALLDIINTKRCAKYLNLNDILTYDDHFLKANGNKNRSTLACGPQFRKKERTLHRTKHATLTLHQQPALLAVVALTHKLTELEGNVADTWSSLPQGL